MKVKELRDVLTSTTVAWIETRDERNLDANEVRCLTHKYDDCDIFRILVQRYTGWGHGITVRINQTLSELDETTKGGNNLV